MPATASPTAAPPAGANPYGTYMVQPTPTGIRFQVCVHHPHNKWLLTGLLLKSLGLGLFTYGHACVWNGLGTLVLLLALDALFFFGIRGIRLVWIEVRPDGLAITPDVRKPDLSKFFDRRGITRRQVDFDQGFTLRYGIYDVQATPPFANEREFEIFQVQLEQAISRLWHQQNL